MSVPTVTQKGFPLGGLSDGRLLWAENGQSVRETLWHILLTRPGERVMRPEFGAGLTQFIHQPNTETTRQLLADVARKAIERWEPRIDLLGISVSADPRALSHVVLTVDYRLRSTGARDIMEIGLELQYGTSE